MKAKHFQRRTLYFETFTVMIILNVTVYLCYVLKFVNGIDQYRNTNNLNVGEKVMYIDLVINLLTS